MNKMLCFLGGRMKGTPTYSPALLITPGDRQVSPSLRTLRADLPLSQGERQ